MKVGFAQREITPAIGVRLAGYAGIRISTGIHDPLMVRVLYLDNEKTPATVMIQTDLVGADEDLAGRLAKRVKLDREQITISCIHTHSGPIGSIDLQGLEDIFGPRDEHFVEQWLDQAEIAYRDARATAKVAEVGYGCTEVTGIGTDRHDGTPGDDRLACWVFCQSNGQKVLLYNLACHPTILNASNLMMSADLAAGVIKALGDEYAGVMFLNGSAGDISTRFTRQASDFNEVAAKGELIAAAVRRLTASMVYQPLTDVRLVFSAFTLVLKDVPDGDLIRDRLKKQQERITEAQQQGTDPQQLRVLQSVAEGYHAMLSGRKTLKQLQGLHLQVSFLKINDKIVIGVPVELFSKLSNPYREQDPRWHFVSYANGYYLYLPNEYAYDHDYYEASTSLFKKGEGERLMSLIAEYLNKLAW